MMSSGTPALAGSVAKACNPGYQVCTVVYRITERDKDVYINLFPRHPFPHDTEVPARFSEVLLELLASGSQNWWDRWGSNITIVDVGLTLLHQSATNDDRR